jgi:hypothetical protein
MKQNHLSFMLGTSQENFYQFWCSGFSEEVVCKRFTTDARTHAGQIVITKAHLEYFVKLFTSNHNINKQEGHDGPFIAHLIIKDLN